MKLDAKVIVSKECKACYKYIENIKKYCNKKKHELTIVYIEEKPILALGLLYKARAHGAVIKHAPVLSLYNNKNYITSQEGILNKKTLKNYFKAYE